MLFLDGFMATLSHDIYVQGGGIDTLAQRIQNGLRETLEVCPFPLTALVDESEYIALLTLSHYLVCVGDKTL